MTGASIYFDHESIAQTVAAGGHREIVGGLWDEIGRLQFDFIVARGLARQHRFLDVGCGALRGGVHFVSYLDPGHYYGLDINRPLLDSGREELAALGLSSRLPPANLVASETFEFERFAQTFDCALALSVFTHLEFNRIRQCLERISAVLAVGATFYATFFERPADEPASVPRRHQPGDVTTHDVADPFHYCRDDLQYAAAKLPLDFTYIGAWDHPRAQMMAAFTRRPD